MINHVFCYIDNVCIDSMSVKINRRTIENSTAALSKLDTHIQEYGFYLVFAVVHRYIYFTICKFIECAITM